MIRYVISFVRLFRKPISWWGIDYEQFENLFRTKLTLDFRQKESRSGIMGGKNQSFLGQFLLFSLFGLIVGLSFFSINDILITLTLDFSVIMVMTGTILISEFTSVLFDYRDNAILLARPVSSRTLLFTRLMHIQFHLGSIALALSLCSAVVLAIKTNLLVMLFFIIGVGLCVWFTVFVTTFIYLALSKVVKGERFKDLVTYMQIVMGILIFGGYQIMPRIMDMETVKTAAMAIHWWTYLLPPVWLAGFVKLSLFTGLSAPVYWLALLGLVIPVGGMLVIIRLLAKGFGNLLSEGSEGQTKVEKQTRKTTIRRISLANLFCISGMEVAGWKMALATTGRDRKFKQAVYPSFGFFLVFLFIFLKPDLSDFSASMAKLGESKSYLMLIIFSYFFTTGIIQLPFTDTPEAAWIYQALPVRGKRHILTGAVKALLVKFFAPLYLIVSVIILLIWGPKIIPAMILGCLLVILVTLLTLIIQKTGLPFTKAREMIGKGTNMLKNMVPMLILVAASGVIFLTTMIPAWGALAGCGLAVAGITTAYSKLRKEVAR